MPLFDAYLFVDWSAANTIQPSRPGPDAVWSGEYIPACNYRQEKYYRLRRDAADYIINVLIKLVRAKQRVLLGFDFPYGYPAGFARALGLDSGDARAWWRVWGEIDDKIQDRANNNNNRFAVAEGLNAIAGNSQAGPFWGCPVRCETDILKRRSPGFPFDAGNGVTLQRLRLVETRLPGTREVWGLYGPGRAGSQALTGIPLLHQLRLHPELAPCSLVWPFETYFTPTPAADRRPCILHAEIWPGIVKAQVRALMGGNPGMIRDEAQVRAMCTLAAEMDRQNMLGHYFAPPEGLNPREMRACTREEGWILGAR